MPKRKKKNQARQALGRISNQLDLPRSVLGSTAHIELSGNREAFVEGCKGILEYDDCRIRLNTGKLVVCFSGSGLSISALQLEQAVITGNIVSVEFSS